MHNLYIKDAAAMKRLGGCLANYMRPAASIWLQGSLGAGKTTLCQGLIRGLGCEQTVKSPTFTLVNSYTIGELIVHHFDFYRVSDPYEFDLIGARDYFANDALCMIEWPEHAEAMLPPPTLSINLTIDGRARHAKLKGNLGFPTEKIIEDFKS